MALKIGFIGGGNMASCIFKGIVKSNHGERSALRETHGL